MMNLPRIFAIAVALTAAVAAAPAQASYAFADPGETAVLNFGGNGIASDSAVTAGATGSLLSFSTANAVVFGSHELEAVLGMTPSLPGDVTLETGAGNNGVWFTLDYARFPGMASPSAPAGSETGTLQFAITSTLEASVTTMGVLQLFTLAGELEITDLDGFYTAPAYATFRLAGNTSTQFAPFGYSLQIEVEGDDSVTVTEPGMLAMIGGGLLAVGIAGVRRRH